MLAHTSRDSLLPVYSLHKSCELLLFIKYSHERTQRTHNYVDVSSTAMHKALKFLLVDMNTAALTMTSYSFQVSIPFIFFVNYLEQYPTSFLFKHILLTKFALRVKKHIKKAHRNFCNPMR